MPTMYATKTSEDPAQRAPDCCSPASGAPCCGGPPAEPKRARPSAFDPVTVLSVHHWTERLFSFTTTRNASLRFANGNFTMVGLPIHGKPLVRAYSIASPNHRETLEFLSIKVPDGPLTSHLQHIQVGDTVLCGHKPTGTLVIDYLNPGKRLYLFATGTGVAPFMAIVQDPATYERFEQVVLVHGCRLIAELAYRDHLSRELPADPYLGELVRGQLKYYPTVTREPFTTQGRITALIESGQMTRDLGLPALDPATDRAMICGSWNMLKDTREALARRGFQEGSAARPGDFVVERAFVSS